MTELPHLGETNIPQPMDVAGECSSYYEYMISVFMYVRLLAFPVEGIFVHGFARLDVEERLRVQLIHINLA